MRLTATALAKIIGLGRTRIASLAKEGVVTKGKDGKYGSDAITAYVERLRGRADQRTSFDDLIAEEKHRKLQRENDEAEALVAPVQELQDALEDVAAQMVPILENIPLLIKRAWPEITGDQIQLVKASIAESRNIIAGIELGKS